MPRVADGEDVLVPDIEVRECLLCAWHHRAFPCVSLIAIP